MRKKTSIFLSLLIVCMLLIPCLASAAGTLSVLYTSDSKAQPGCCMCVDLEAMTDYDARIWNAFLEGTAEYVWKKDGTVIADAVTKVRYFSDLDVGHTYQVIVTCDDLVIEGAAFVVEAAPAPEVPDVVIDPPEIKTSSLPKATAGKEYYVRLDSTDPDAVFTIYYNPGKENGFEKTGLILTQHGEIEGTPKKAGKYTFTVVATNDGGEGYQVYTLTVEEAVTQAPEKTESDTPVSSEIESVVEEPENSTIADISEEVPEKSEVAEEIESVIPEVGTTGAEEKAGMPWWGILLIALAAAGVGAGVVLLILKNRK